ncbi:hypothetical protein DSCW_20250 [Desulfosarcina widdelii]|uniref:Uncharacterized protein n=1 Tax=Desulfosarcina widdelii TaxID=947919 RepID=A0A5K7Z128_9BACT|nr:hypothetical protein [Desulfosarcina widdelii]BBO74608.1 hypothetical protein DSCW_20250 [Desulfosarcina widdelii]
MRTKQFSKSLSVALPSEHFDQIKKITDDLQISMAQWIRAAVEMALQTKGETLQ